MEMNAESKLVGNHSVVRGMYCIVFSVWSSETTRMMSGDSDVAVRAPSAVHDVATRTMTPRAAGQNLRMTRGV